MFNLKMPVALAVLMVCSASARAADVGVVAGAIDIERSNAASIVTRIRADAAYARAITGRGVTIALLDSGVAINHREFAAAGKLLPGFNALSGGIDVTDHAGHGTHVAGIIGAGRDGHGMFGVAHEATLLPVKVFPDSGSGSTVVLDRGLRYAIGKAAIVNMSVAAAGPYDPRAMQAAVEAGMLLVASAGNAHAANPGWPARFAREAWANNQIIAVGAVDSANRIASFSNRAGDAAAWFLVAPGVGIVSTYLDGQYASLSGTSMAAPVVSGAAALVMQLWPALRADQVANILFVTATDLGAPGIDPVYGRGLLNVEKALQPVGTLTTTTLNGRVINVLSGSTQPSPATSALWNMAASGQLRVAGLDDFQRDFGVDLGATVARPAAMSMMQAMGSMDGRIEVAEQVLENGNALSAAYERAPTAGTQRRLSSFSLRAQDAQGRDLTVGIGGLAPQYFGIGALQLPQNFALAQVSALANPYFALVPGASHAALAQQVGDVKLRFGMMSTGFNQMLDSQQGYLPPSGTLPEATSGLLEVSQSFGAGALSVSLLQTRESNAYLGSYANGPLSLGPGAATSALQLAGAVMLTPTLAFAGQAAYGVTPGGGSSDSLITEVSKARTNAFSLALVAADQVRHGDRLSVSLSQPMRAYAGRISMDVLSRSSGNGMARERLVFSMVPLGREMRVQLSYQTPAGWRGNFGATLIVRRDPNNMDDVAVERLLVLRYIKQF